MSITYPFSVFLINCVVLLPAQNLRFTDLYFALCFCCYFPLFPILMYLSLTYQFRPSSPISCSFNPRKPLTAPPARDLVIDFGKYKGKMLGTLPSTYLKWISNNLRARDFEHWANLADQVLQDPVYKDRIEWEFADNILRGKDYKNNANESADASLSEISERFGWDNGDKIGWRKVNFELLGTSNGGRIPRKVSSATNCDSESVEEERVKREKVRVLSVSEERRRGRRERMRSKKREETVGMEDKMGIIEEKKGKIENGVDGDKSRTVEIYENPFPGREGLVKEVLRRRKFI
ncbi:hypothetical protein HS088_TW12G00410 [Tripterygium wilfordii]|uniref:Uncharacterized protein n=1 Tax=Tripterygium wilfordii TaxID=458696 RepID=A0A7J7CZ22_TRIWF|nr:hypothetical protein HS088_TW12G00410 [Tripterygium wilfordii]